MRAIRLSTLVWLAGAIVLSGCFGGEVAGKAGAEAADASGLADAAKSEATQSVAALEHGDLLCEHPERPGYR